MSVRLKILNSNGDFLRARQPGDAVSKDYIFCLTETEGSYIEALNKGLRSSQSEWFPQYDFASNNPRDSSTYYTQVGEEHASGSSSGIRSAPKYSPWRFRTAPSSRLNELFWPTQFQRHAEMYVAFMLNTLDANLFKAYRDRPYVSGPDDVPLGIDRVYIQFGPNELSGDITTGPYFYMRCAGIHVYNGYGLTDTIIEENSIFIMKLVDDRYYWNNLEIQGNGRTNPESLFDWPEGLAPTPSAYKHLADWGRTYPTLNFTDKGNVNLYNERKFGFALYPHSFPSSGLRRGIVSDWVAWTQGFIPVVLPNFDSFPLKEKGGASETKGYGYFSFAPAFLAEDALYPRDWDAWMNRYSPDRVRASSIFNQLGFADTGVMNMTTRSTPSDAFHEKSDPFVRSTWADISQLRSRTNGTKGGFLGRIKIDLREQDILQGDRFITNSFLGEGAGFLGSRDRPADKGGGGSTKYNEFYLNGELGKVGEISTPVVTVNTALFSNEIIDTTLLTSQAFYDAPDFTKRPSNGDDYDPIAGNSLRNNVGSNINSSHQYFVSPQYRILIDACQRITTQYEYLALLDTGPESREYIDWGSVRPARDGEGDDGLVYWTEWQHHSIKYKQIAGERGDDRATTTPWAAVGPWFFTYESFVFTPLLTEGAKLTLSERPYSQVSATATSYRKDSIPQEMPITWGAPNEITFQLPNLGDSNTLHVALHNDAMDDGQQIYAEGTVVLMPGLTDETYYLKINKVKSRGSLNWEDNFKTNPIVRLHHPPDWPTTLEEGIQLTCMRMPESSSSWWSDQWIPLNSLSVGTKQLVRFTLDVALTTADASQPATITDQYGPGTDNSNTAITAHNLLTHTAGTYMFEGNAGDAGLAMRDADQDYRIIQIECADTPDEPDPDPGGGGGDPGGETP
jgi:hypothetical protein